MVSDRDDASLDIRPGDEKLLAPGFTERYEPHTRRPLVYCAGPYTNPDPVENTHDAIVLADRLYETGLVVPVTPHLTALWHMVIPHPYTFWLDYDLEVMRGCHAVYRWEGESSGADGEVREARDIGQPVFFNEQELLKWAEGWKP